MATVDPALIEEAYASFDDEGDFIVTVELDHPGFAETLRIVTGIDAPDGDFEIPIMLPITAGGQKLAHRVCAFGFTRPGADEDGPTEGRCNIDGVNGYIYPYLRDALAYGHALNLTVRIYLWHPIQGTGVIQGPDEEFIGLQMTVVNLDEVQAEGAVRWPDGRQLNFPTGPNALFNREDYKALFSY